MNMPKDFNVTIGVTIERTQHSQIAVEPRTITKGGMIASYGNRDLDHCLLDYLYRRNLLGGPEDSQERYNIGYRLRDLWCSFNQSEINLEQRGQGKKEFVSEGEIAKGNDYLEAMFNKIMKALPAKYQIPVRALCLEDRWVKEHNQCLDALYGAFHRFDATREEFDKKMEEQQKIFDTPPKMSFTQR